MTQEIINVIYFVAFLIGGITILLSVFGTLFFVYTEKWFQRLSIQINLRNIESITNQNEQENEFGRIKEIIGRVQERKHEPGTEEDLNTQGTKGETIYSRKIINRTVGRT